MGEKCRREEKGKICAALTPYLQETLTAVDCDRIARELAMTKANVMTTLSRLKKTLRQILYDEIAQTVTSEAEIKEEFAILRAAVR